MKRAIVIIPTYNERENIAHVVPILETVFQKISTWDMHILVVDDSSPDRTADVARSLAEKYTNVHLLLNPKKSGLGGAYLKGMAEAFGPLKADAVFEFDADLSHDPQKLPDFIDKLNSGYDMVLGSRYIPGGSIPDNWGWYRKMLSVVGNLVIMLILTDFSIKDWTGGYRAITRPVYEAVISEMSSEQFSGYTFQIGFLHKAVRKGFKITEVPFHFVDRTIGQSKLGAEYLKNTLMYLLNVRFQEIIHHRIFKFVVVGGTGALVQLLSLSVLRRFLPYQIAFFLGIELAVVSNFVLNNIWTFSDRKLKIAQVPASFVKFNVASFGSIVIQQVIAILGQFLIGFPVLFILPVLHKPIDMGLIYAVVGILIGMFWNFFAYNKFVWVKK